MRIGDGSSEIPIIGNCRIAADYRALERHNSSDIDPYIRHRQDYGGNRDRIGCNRYGYRFSVRVAVPVGNGVGNCIGSRGIKCNASRVFLSGICSSAAEIPVIGDRQITSRCCSLEDHRLSGNDRHIVQWRINGCCGFGVRLNYNSPCGRTGVTVEVGSRECYGKCPGAEEQDIARIFNGRICGPAAEAP